MHPVCEMSCVSYTVGKRRCLLPCLVLCMRTRILCERGVTWCDVVSLHIPISGRICFWFLWASLSRTIHAYSFCAIYFPEEFLGSFVLDWVSPLIIWFVRWTRALWWFGFSHFMGVPNCEVCRSFTSHVLIRNQWSWKTCEDTIDFTRV